MVRNFTSCCCFLRTVCVCVVGMLFRTQVVYVILRWWYVFSHCLRKFCAESRRIAETAIVHREMSNEYRGNSRRRIRAKTEQKEHKVQRRACRATKEGQWVLRTPSAYWDPCFSLLGTVRRTQVSF